MQGKEVIDRIVHGINENVYKTLVRDDVHG